MTGLTRRQMFAVSLATLAPAGRAFAQTGSSVRGRLEIGETPVLIVEGRRIPLAGDEDTMKVLADDRLKDADFEVAGRWESTDRFTASPIASHALFVYKGSKRLFVTYWCDNCSVRYLIPGPCVCCGKNTDLDLRDKPE